MNNSYLNLKNFIFINGTTIIFSSLFYILLYIQYDIKQNENNGYCINSLHPWKFKMEQNNYII